MLHVIATLIFTGLLAGSLSALVGALRSAWPEIESALRMEGPTTLLPAPLPPRLRVVVRTQRPIVTPSLRAAA